MESSIVAVADSWDFRGCVSEGISEWRIATPWMIQVIVKREGWAEAAAQPARHTLLDDRSRP
jgi:hypothetical protein